MHFRNFSQFFTSSEESVVIPKWLCHAVAILLCLLLVTFREKRFNKLHWMKFDDSNLNIFEEINSMRSRNLSQFVPETINNVYGKYVVIPQ